MFGDLSSGWHSGRRSLRLRLLAARSARNRWTSTPNSTGVDPVRRGGGSRPGAGAPRNPLARGGPQRVRVVSTSWSLCPPKETYLLYVVPNPVNACRVALYKEHFVEDRPGWIPDTLMEVTRLPDFGVMPDPDDNIEGQNTRLYLLDLWIPPNADVARFRAGSAIEGGRLDRRADGGAGLAGAIPRHRRGGWRNSHLACRGTGGGLPGHGGRAEYVSGSPLRVGLRPTTLRGIIRRNAVQDMALAASLDPAIAGPDAVERRVIDLFWNNFRFVPHVFGAEWYLRVRDFLYNQSPSR